MAEMKKRLHAFFTGHVQGVGFRITAEELAQQFKVTGWVKNLRDGRVEMVAEADESILESFLERLQTGEMKRFIKRVELTWNDATENFDDFRIRY